MERIRKLVEELKTRRDWKGIDEVSAVIDEIGELANVIQKEHERAIYTQGNIIVELREKIKRLEKGAKNG